MPKQIASVCLLLLSLLSLGQTAVAGARQAGNVAIITIKGEITGGNSWDAVSPGLNSVHRRIQLAQRAGADAIVFEIDTPGGHALTALGICNEIKSSPIKNTIAWVHPSAYSAGAIIALACREIVVSDPATMGDAVPIRIDPAGGLHSVGEAERQKMLAPLLSELVDSARRNHYDEFLVQGIVSLGVELWLVENKESGDRLFINRAEYVTLFGEEPSDTAASITAAPPAPNAAGAQAAPVEKPPRAAKRGGRGWPRASQPIPTGEPDRVTPAAPGLERAARDSAAEEQEVPSVRPVLTSADQGKWKLIEHVSTGAGPLLFKSDQMLRYGLASGVVQNDEDLKKFLGAKHLVRLDQSWSEGLVVWLTWMPVQALLVVIFLLALFVEMTHPGVMLPGAIAFTALAALLAPPLIINLASWWVVAAIGSGILLIALEIFVIPGFGIPGVAGLMLLFGGLIGVFVPAGSFFPDSPQRQSDLLHGVVSLLLALATSGAGMYFIARNFKSLPFLGRLVLKDPTPEERGDDLLAAMGDSSGPVRRGMFGMTITPLRPAGRVELTDKSGARIIDVVAEIGYIPPGVRVRVVSVSDFRIGVELAPDDSGVASA